MFTGLIEDVGTVVSSQRIGSAACLTVTTSLPCSEINIGDSVAVNGVCLTVTQTSGKQLSFDVSPESLSCTTMGLLHSSDNVNLERALRLGDRLGGHIVSGHIDCIARLIGIQEISGNRVLTFSLSEEYGRYLISKGSVTIDGISLTVNSVATDRFSVNIIPHTGKATTITNLAVNDSVNIETDIIGKYVERLTKPWIKSGGLSMKTLAENGFI